jgi:hypothetical protein
MKLFETVKLRWYESDLLMAEEDMKRINAYLAIFVLKIIAFFERVKDARYTMVTIKK